MSDQPRDHRRRLDRLEAKAEMDNARLSAIPERVGRRGGKVLAVRVVVEKPDYLICIVLGEDDARPNILASASDVSDTARDVINVAKDIELRRTHLDGLKRPNRDGELLLYTAIDANGTERRCELASDSTKNELQVVIPPIIAEQEIDGDTYAGSYLTIKIVANGTGVLDDAGNDIFALDSNNSARAFAEKD